MIDLIRRLELVEQRMAGTGDQPVEVVPVEDWITGEVTIEDPQASDGNTIIPFSLWPAQRDLLRAIVEHVQIVILKARQIGVTWLVIAYAVWLCLFYPAQVVLCFSKDQDAANDLIRRARGIYARLRRKPVALVVDNVTMLEWSNGSRIKSFAATEDAGSSFTASLTLLDEFAKMRYAESLYTSVKPTINDGGRIIVISTAKGEGNLFHKLWGEAIKGLNNLKPIFFPWQARPDRTPEWYARAAADAVSPALHTQEYPLREEDAFVTVGEDRFLSSMIWWDACQESLPALGAYETMLLAMDAGISHDSFGLIGVTPHPTRAGVYAIRVVREWKPAGGKLDFYAEDGPDAAIRWLCANYNVPQLEYDPWQLHSLATKLMSDGVVYCHVFNQGNPRLIADKYLLDAILAKRIAHDGNAALRAHVDNANRRPDPENRQLRIVKRSEHLPIDLCVCASMGLYRTQGLLREA